MAVSLEGSLEKIREILEILEILEFPENEPFVS